MNKLLYRVIFSRARGMLMVVADIAHSRQGKQPGSSRSKLKTCRQIITLSALRFTLLTTLGCVWVLPIQAAIVADGQAAGNLQPSVINSANGITQVNIQTPSAGGVSRNEYSQFDVDHHGVILNNSHAATETQLGGMVAGNPWLAKGEARIILNEVNSHNASQLNGYIEVAGKKAQVIIANPAGITCDGCGFINANRATLTTGQAQLNNGNLTGYRVNGGAVTVTGSGMDTRGQDYTDIIARTVKANAGIWANDLKVITGSNQVDAGHNAIVAISADAATRPQLALDVSALGGMYANKIQLIGTEKGVGVSNAGAIGAAAGSVTISADGRIENSGTVNSTQNMALVSQGAISNSGTLYAQQNSQIQAQAEVSNQGVIAAAQNTHIEAATLDNSSNGVLAAGMNAAGKLGQYGDLTLTSRGQLTSRGGNLAANDLKIQATGIDLGGSQTYGKQVELDASAGDISLRNAMVEAQGDLHARSQARLINDGGKLQADKLQLNARQLSNRQGTISQLGGDSLLLAHPEGIDNSVGSIASNGGDLKLDTSSLNNMHGKIQHAGSGLLAITANSLQGEKGSIVSNGDLQLRGETLNLDAATTAGNSLTLEAQRLSHRQGEMVQRGSGTMTVKVTEALDNHSGKISANGSIDINADSLSNRQGQIVAAGQGALHAVTQGGLDNFQGTLVASKDLTLDTSDINNTQGTISAVTGSTQLTTTTLNNAFGRLNAGQSLRVTSHGINNQNGLINADSLELQLQTGSLNNRQGVIASAKDTRIFSGAIDNSAGLLQSGRNSQIDTQGQQLDNRASGSKGGIIALGQLQLQTGSLDNRGGVINARDLHLFNGEIDNQQGILAAQNALSLAAGKIDNRNQGVISSGQQLQLNSDDLLNSQGLLLSEGTATLNTANLDNRQGKIGARSDLSVNSRQLQNDAAGLLQSGADMYIDTHGQTLSNTASGEQGGLISQGNMHILAGDLNNRQGVTLANGSIDLAANTLFNQGGKLIGLNGIIANSAAVNNQHGVIQSAQRLSWNSHGNIFDNREGLVSAQQDFTLFSGDVHNFSGKLLSASKLDITADTVDNSDGQLASQGELGLGAAALNNLRGAVQAMGNMALTLVNDFTNDGVLQTNGDLSLSSMGDIDNNQQIQAGQTLSLNADNLLNQSRGEISASTTQINAWQQLTNYGLIDGFYTRLNGKTISNIGTGRIYGDYLAIGAGTLNNLAEQGNAATLAARQRLDIGSDTLNNRDHALLYSDGMVSIGGRLDANWQATGQASLFNNHSATLESTGDLLLNVATVNNINDHFSTEIVEVSQEHIDEYQVSGNDNRYGRDDVSFDHDEVDFLLTPDYPWKQNDANDNWYHYDYLRTIKETRIKESDPGKIISGGDLTIDANTVLNDKSQIIAGKNLQINADKLDNVEVSGERQISDEGEVYHYWRIHNKGSDGQGSEHNDYIPPTVIQGITLKPSINGSHSQIDGSGLVIDQRTDARIEQIAVDSASGGSQHPLGTAISLPPEKIFEVTVDGPANGNDVGSVIRTQGPNTQLPDNSLFKANPATDASYLIESDPRFTDRQKWLGSDYMMQALQNDPNNVFKRLGDGYYEQRLIREQVIALTGQRYLTGYDSDQQQYKALMDAGIAFAKEHHLTPGVALTVEQMRLLTSDMVWLVTRTVQLADGRSQQVLVPQLYVRVQPGDLDGSGALLAGKNISINLQGDLNNSGRIKATGNTQVLGNNLNNLGGLIQGNNTALQARTDINNLGGVLQGTQALTALAGRDINVTTSTRNAQSDGGDFTRNTIDRLAGIYVEKGDGTLALQAGRDLNLTAAQVVNSSGNGSSVLSAGRDLNLNTVTTGSRDNLNFSDSNWLHQSSSQQQGSEIAAKGDLGLLAGNNLSATAVDLNAGGKLALTAGHDLQIANGENSSQMEEHFKASGTSGVASKTTLEQHTRINSQTAQGSMLSGDSVALLAGNNLQLQGSDIVGTQDVRLSAGNNLTVTAAQQQRDELHVKQENTSGLSGTGGVGISYGKSEQKSTSESHSTHARGSTVGSVQGNLLMQAGSDLRVDGSDVVAGKDLTLTGKNLTLSAAEQTLSQKQTYESKQSGLTLALSGVVGSALNSAVNTAKETKEESNSRLQALKGVQTALSAVQAVQATQPGAASTNDAIGVSLSYGSQQSKSENRLEQHTHKGSSLMAGNNLNLIASGNGVQGQDGDINVQGSQLQAGNELLLHANRDINLLSSQETESTRGTNSSSGGSVGVSVGAGSGGMGVSVSASINKGKGHENSDSLSHTETQIKAGERVTIVSGRDTTLTGAQISAETVKAQVGRNLTLTSEQDSARYEAEQKNTSAGASVAVVGAGGSASISTSQDKMHSNYQSVQEQTGIFAGKGGFDVTVGEHTQLNGATIGSTATVDKNRLETGTLGFGDMQNQADFVTEHQSAGISTGGSVGSQFAGNMANNLLVGANNEGHDSSITHAAVSDGTIVIRDTSQQQQDVAALSRDVENANPGLEQIFDKEKEQNRLKEAQLIGQIGNQVADIARTQGQIEAAKAATDKMKEVTPAQLQAAKDEWSKANPGKVPKEEDIRGQVYQNFYNQAFTGSGLGTGGKVQQAIQAATAAVQGLAGGDISKALAGGSAPYIANIIGSSGLDDAGKVLAHAAVNAALAAAQGNSALVGATGAATGEMAGMIASNVYGKPTGELSETEKQTVSALATLAAGLAGGLTGDSTADAIAGAQVGKTTVENNSLSGDQARATAKQAAESLKDKVREKLGDGTTSSIANGIITALADTGDAALGGADYAADAAMALASCAAGDSYCGTALNDLSGKNQAVADSVKALMSSDTWSAVADTIKQASEGNQVALEATGGMLAGIILPGKKVPHVPNASAVGNMSEFLKKTSFGGEVKNITRKTSKQYQGQSVYQAQGKTGNLIKKGDQLYLDAMHKNHLEVFDKNGNFKAVLNLDGAVNIEKTNAGQGRKLKID